MMEDNDVCLRHILVVLVPPILSFGMLVFPKVEIHFRDRKAFSIIIRVDCPHWLMENRNVDRGEIAHRFRDVIAVV